MTELTKCWAELEGKIAKLTEWVDASKSGQPAQAGLSIDKLEEQLNVLKSNFTEKQTLIEGMMAKCKAHTDGRRKSQINMNVRRMTMLPVEEMRKLSQMVQDEQNKKPGEDYPDLPAESAAPAAEEAAVEATVQVPAPDAPAEELPEVKGEPEL